MSYAAQYIPHTPPSLSIVGRGGSKLFLVTGGRDAQGLLVWHYVRVPSLRQAGFNRAIMSGNIDFTEYGEVVRSGFGATPPEDVVRQMEDESA